MPQRVPIPPAPTHHRWYRWWPEPSAPTSTYLEEAFPHHHLAGIGQPNDDRAGKAVHAKVFPASWAQFARPGSSPHPRTRPWSLKPFLPLDAESIRLPENWPSECSGQISDRLPPADPPLDHLLASGPWPAQCQARRAVKRVDKLRSAGSCRTAAKSRATGSSSELDRWAQPHQTRRATRNLRNGLGPNADKPQPLSASPGNCPRR